MGGKAVSVIVSVEFVGIERKPQCSSSHRDYTPVLVFLSSPFSVFGRHRQQVHQGVKSVIKLSLKHHHH